MVPSPGFPPESGAGAPEPSLLQAEQRSAIANAAVLILRAAGQGGLILDIPTGIAIATVGLIA
jgi:hypothetical protein